MRVESSLLITAGKVKLEGDLVVPRAAQGLVLFAHGSGTSRLSTRNLFVARALQDRGLATLLFDLMTAEEERQDALGGRVRFDVPLLSGRLGEVTDWALQHPSVHGLPLGYFGASTGSAAALVAAAQRPGTIRAVVSRGGRPDLAGTEVLKRAHVPVQLIVGGDDVGVLELNQASYERLPGPKQLSIVPGATHLFEEPGALDEVARIGGDWFAEHLAGSQAAWAPWP